MRRPRSIPWDTAAAGGHRLGAARHRCLGNHHGIARPGRRQRLARCPTGATDALSAQADAAGQHTGFALHQLWDGSLTAHRGLDQPRPGLGGAELPPFFQTVRVPIDGTLSWVESLLTSIPALAMIALLGLLAWQFAGA